MRAKKSIVGLGSVVRELRCGRGQHRLGHDVALIMEFLVGNGTRKRQRVRTPSEDCFVLR